MSYRYQDKAKSEFKNHIDVYGLDGKKENDPEDIRENTFFDNTVEKRESFLKANGKLIFLLIGVSGFVILILWAMGII